ncbi:MAG: biopolymer transporter ExbD [Desulfuromusa sp.]|jgi:biopolymer transport protein ExbD|nr:biopolymer transporter ExbD [Desulfuromusa sp.]
MINFSEQSPVDTIGFNLTPLVDVIFILLIFFILTANSSRGIVLDLPPASTAEILPSEHWEIVITKNDQLLFNGLKIEKERLEGILLAAKKQEQNQPLVILKAHQAASVNAFVSVMDSVRKTGFDNLVIATDIKRDEP